MPLSHCKSSMISYSRKPYVPYSGLISRGEIFVDWIVKTFRRYIFEVITISPDKFHYNENFRG